MTQILEAVYENGMFRPLKTPDLSEGQAVQLLVSLNPDSAAAERIKRFRGILQKPNVERSLAEELIQERREEAVRE
jgi:predicted DNA-binding antitoxin AbrB/MazE fold protein